MILFAVYCLGFIAVGVMIYIAASILDQLTRERVQLHARGETRVEMMGVSNL